MMKEHLKSFILRIYKADIVRVFSLTSLTTLIRMLTGFVSIKVVAVIVGPSGIALIGQLNNFIQIISSAAQGGINNGVTKYIAQDKTDKTKVKTLISTAFRTTLYCSLFSGLVCIAFANILSKYVMLSDKYGYLFVILGIMLLFFALNSLILSIVNGFEQFKLYVKISTLNAIFGVIYTVILVLLFGLVGALIGIVTFQSIMFLITFFVVRDLGWFSIEYWHEKIDKITLRKYLHYTLMTMVTAIMIPISQLILRSYVMTEISTTEAGWWEALNRLSNMYLMVITSSFMVYYMPKLSAAMDSTAVRHEVFKAAKFIIPLLTIGLIIIYFMRIFLINFLFASDFLPMQNLFIWQLLGDFFKISSWLIAFIMVAKSQTKRYISVEIMSGLIYLISALCFIYFTQSVVGIVQAYLLNYILYFCAMVFLYRKLLFSRPLASY